MPTAHPENYRHLSVRISGYNAHFVTLNQQMQIELIERAGTWSVHSVAGLAY